MKSRLTFLAILLSFALPLALHAKETKDIQFRFKHADAVVFSHDIHLSKYNNNCRICHNAIFDIRKRKHFTMADMEKTKSCGACHSGIKAFSVSSEKDCVRCHKSMPHNLAYKVKGVGDATFSHDLHLTKTGGKCKSCHNGAVITGKDNRVTMAQMEKGKTCGACHNGKKAFTVTGNCDKCHKGFKTRDINFKVKGINDVVFSHTIHTGMFKCAECHTKTFPFKAGGKHFKMSDMESGKSCGACHNGKDAFTAAGNCETCHKGFKPANISFKTPDVGNVTFSHDFHLGMYKCADCHTKAFPFKAGAIKASMPDMEAGKSCGVCHNGKDAFSVKADCEKCHKQ